MTDYRRLARAKVMRLRCQLAAQRIAARARSLDPDGDYRVEPYAEVVGGLAREGARVINVAASAARNEFGNSRTPRRRALGRAASSSR